MSQGKNRNPLDSLEQDATLAAVTAMALGEKADGSKPSGTNAALERLLAVMEAKWAKELQKDEEKEEELRRLLAARSESFKHEIARREAIQRACDHRKENGRPCIGGQRLSNDHYAFICQHCWALWDETTLPPHLSVNLDAIGG